MRIYTSMTVYLCIASEIFDCAQSSLMTPDSVNDGVLHHELLSFTCVDTKKLEWSFFAVVTIWSCCYL